MAAEESGDMPAKAFAGGGVDDEAKVAGQSDGALVPEAHQQAASSADQKFRGRIKADTQKPPFPGAGSCTTDGRPRIRCNLGLTPYGLPGCWPR